MSLSTPWEVGPMGPGQLWAGFASLSDQAGAVECRAEKSDWNPGFGLLTQVHQHGEPRVGTHFT